MQILFYSQRNKQQQKGETTRKNVAPDKRMVKYMGSAKLANFMSIDYYLLAMLTFTCAQMLLVNSPFRIAHEPVTRLKYRL